MMRQSSRIAMFMGSAWEAVILNREGRAGK